MLSLQDPSYNQYIALDNYKFSASSSRVRSRVLSPVDAFQAAVKSDPAYPQAVAAFDYFANEKNRHSLYPRIERYYQHIQFDLFGKFQKFLPDQMNGNIRSLVETSFVLGANHQLDETYRSPVGDCLLLRETKQQVCQSLLEGDPAIIADYIREKPDFDRLHKNAKVHVYHDVGCAMYFARQDGAAYARYRARSLSRS